ncbi:FeS assembly SUF system regulator [Roseomonas pecuniae]|uniref:FeS assembly SUF system regulator n=1 Tax=Muricoccus pecuniae TaxID=693023 RepID=A0A840YEX9_9PROT|nr:FeS assembly SUF system regulator [Roseomonas pecuniae]
MKNWPDHTVLRLSKLADYAVVLLARLGQEEGLHTVPALSATTGIAEPTVAKVLRILSQSLLVEAQRGARGGHRLARPISAISLAEVIVAMDGPIALTACVDGNTGGCEAEGHCPVRGRWDPVNEAVRAALTAVTIADLARPSCTGMHRRAPVFPANPGAGLTAAPLAAE